MSCCKHCPEKTMSQLKAPNDGREAIACPFDLCHCKSVHAIIWQASFISFLPGLQALQRDPSPTSGAPGPRRGVPILEQGAVASSSGANQWAFGRRAAGRGRRSAQEWVRESNVADSTWAPGLAQYRPDTTGMATLKSGPCSSAETRIVLQSLPGAMTVPAALHV